MSFTYDASISMTSNASVHEDPVAQATARTRQWCERVAQANGLDAEQLDDLKSLVNLASGQDDSIIRLFIWQQATQYRILNHVLKKYVDLDRFMRLLRDVENHLGTAWVVPPELKVIVKVETRDIIVEHDQPAYTTIHMDVMAYLRLHKERLDIKDVFGNPSREALLNAYVKKAASNARTSLREALILSVCGKGKKSLEDATWDIMGRFKKGGAGTNLKTEYQIRIALLRRWTYEELFQTMQPVEPATPHIAQDGPDPDGNGPASLSDLLADDATAPPPKKRQREDEETVLKPTVGKVPKGEDFWSKIDRRIDFTVASWGNNLKDPQWRSYIDDTVARDRRVFGRCTSGVLPPIPMQVTPPPATSLSTPASTQVTATAPPTPLSLSTPTHTFSNPGTSNITEHADEDQVAFSPASTPSRASLWS